MNGEERFERYRYGHVDFAFRAILSVIHRYAGANAERLDALQMCEISSLETIWGSSAWGQVANEALV